MQLLRQDLTDLFIRQGSDWSKDAIYTALKNKGVDLAELERLQNLKPGTMRNAFYRACPAYEQVIAQAIGVEPAVIWPSRYQPKNSQHVAA
ncbi:transcriptional regulator [Salmonella enterica subsp. enterica serovar Vitkin]|uniref:Transcriptional regulator n=4 Tax=Salmonella TaxID=590 RepID=A0A3X9ZPD1_SALNE|nr:helix-turn-helix domain-containing protein [Salmonella bongori]EAA5542288.1 transcriptional regulator [Salmonella enterica subsp. enterica serovar Abony]EAA5550366.1 transcriptional regulator [Salmonella enterica subsp. enterica serovar Newport]EAS2829534.1 transcriptional regulator [Salmonella enterica]EBF9679316.1 transcriptional regulator [Salmonella enterica subsp. enterica serovar Glostrup]EBQ9794054.1 transcriptional regulator [Salmonella enterica subsp. enterica serovar Kottbus]ECA9